MKIITLLSQKGGSGKSTLALSLAVYADAIDRNALVIDLDPQSSAASWYNRRKTDGNETPLVMPAQAIQLPQILADAQENGADIVFIDTAPHTNNVSTKAVEACDLVLIPCRASMMDIDAIETSIQVTRLVQKKAAVVINAIHPNAPQMFNDVSTAISENYDVEVLPVFVSQRSEFVHAATQGQSPTDTAPFGKASGEIKALYEIGYCSGYHMLAKPKQYGKSGS